MRDKCIAQNWVLPLMQLFLKKLIVDEIKQIALGHCIVQASRPRFAVSPIVLGVGVSVDYHTSKPRVVQLLSRLGLSISPDAVNRFKQSVTQSCDENLPHHYVNVFTQWAADDVDRNINTLDGQGTFHEMGIISTSVSNTVSSLVSDGTYTDKPIKETEQGSGA